MAVVGACCLSFIFVATNKMKTLHYLVIAFWVGVITTFLCAGVSLAEYMATGRSPFMNLTMRSFLELLGASLTNFLGFNLLTCSNQMGLPATVALLVYTQVLYNYLADYIFFHVDF